MMKYTNHHLQSFYLVLEPKSAPLGYIQISATFLFTRMGLVEILVPDAQPHSDELNMMYTEKSTIYLPNVNTTLLLFRSFRKQAAARDHLRQTVHVHGCMNPESKIERI